MSLESIYHAERALKMKFPEGIDHLTREEIASSLERVLRALPKLQKLGASKASDEMIAEVLTYLERFKELPGF